MYPSPTKYELPLPSQSPKPARASEGLAGPGPSPFHVARPNEPMFVPDPDAARRAEDFLYGRSDTTSKPAAAAAAPRAAAAPLQTKRKGRDEDDDGEGDRFAAGAVSPKKGYKKAGDGAGEEPQFVGGPSMEVALGISQGLSAFTLGLAPSGAASWAPVDDNIDPSLRYLGKDAATIETEKFRRIQEQHAAAQSGYHPSAGVVDDQPSEEGPQEEEDFGPGGWPGAPTGEDFRFGGGFGGFGGQWGGGFGGGWGDQGVGGGWGDLNQTPAWDEDQALASAYEGDGQYGDQNQTAGAGYGDVLMAPAMTEGQLESRIQAASQRAFEAGIADGKESCRPDLERKDGEIRFLGDRFRDLEAQYKLLQQSQGQEIAELTAKAGELSSRIVPAEILEAAKNKFSAVALDRDQVRSQLETANRDLQAQKLLVEQLQANQRALEAAAAAVVPAGAARADLDEANRKVADLEEGLKDHESLKSDLLAANLKLKSFEQDVKDNNCLTVKLGALELEIATLKGEQAVAETTQRELASTKSTLEEVSLQLEDSQVEKETLLQRVSDSQVENEALCKRVSDSTEKISELESEIASLREGLGTITVQPARDLEGASLAEGILARLVSELPEFDRNETSRRLLCSGSSIEGQGVIVSQYLAKAKYQGSKYHWLKVDLSNVVSGKGKHWDPEARRRLAGRRGGAGLVSGVNAETLGQAPAPTMVTSPIMVVSISPVFPSGTTRGQGGRSSWPTAVVRSRTMYGAAIIVVMGLICTSWYLQLPQLPTTSSRWAPDRSHLENTCPYFPEAACVPMCADRPSPPAIEVVGELLEGSGEHSSYDDCVFEEDCGRPEPSRLTMKSVLIGSIVLLSAWPLKLALGR
ncbi:uncharacterized protein L3040_004094 [Drepanopeziza brunnea f. sp. 'multigermtubi']|uniref:uncharacterized protein n=1 Tax=Drepanopeziza brunnea f. sp. 'multigermtubi' TaxID=698441 RepID=UPI00239AB3A7|nr:hypothetical protein L3040_004094 [Drepanopeziza brunnea f. sp. 'multigermtubi']